MIRMSKLSHQKKMIQLSYLPVSDKLYYDDLNDPANKFQYSKKKNPMKLICKCEFEKVPLISCQIHIPLY